MRADLSRLRPWTVEAAAAEPCAEPSLAVFRRGGKTLIFIATRHVHGRDGAVFSTIARAFREYAPDFLIVEGVPGSDAAAAWLLNRARGRFAGGGSGTEFEYAVLLADRVGIPYRGGEPGDGDVLDVLLSKGFKAEDFLGFNVARNVAQWRREGGLDQARFDALASETLANLASTLGLEPSFRLFEFRRWFAAHAAPGRPLLEYDDEESGPLGGPGATYFQRIACALDGVREGAVVSMIDAALEKRGRVLVVYGSGHLIKQREVWEALLGPAENLKWF